MRVSLGNRQEVPTSLPAPRKKHHMIPGNLPISDQFDILTDVDGMATFLAASTLCFSSSVNALVETLAIDLAPASTTLPSFRI